MLKGEYSHNIDAKGRLICGAAIGVTSDVLDRAGALLAAASEHAHNHQANQQQRNDLLHGVFLLKYSRQSRY